MVAQQVRLQKVLAERGIASRRAAEQMILAGRVRVNHQVVTQLGVKVDPEQDVVEVDGKVLGKPERLRYLLLNKPAGYITSAADERGRRTVLSLLTGVTERVYPVGRLDYHTSGLLLLTNDGALTHALLHPSHHVDKTYHVSLTATPTAQELQQLRRGVMLEDGITAPAQVRLLRDRPGDCLLAVTIYEGRNRQVRRMLAAIGYEVKHLRRVGFAFLDLDKLAVGQWRELTPQEVARLRQISQGHAQQSL